MIQQVFERLREVVDDERLNIGIVRQYLNACYQDAYAKAVALDPEWYTKSFTFSSTASLAVPVNCYDILAYSGTSGTLGGARILDHRTPERINANSIQVGITSDPVAVWTGANIEHTPAFGGVLWYVWNFGEITDDTTTICGPGAGYLALLPAVFEESVLWDCCSQLRMRFAAAQDTPSVADQGLENLTIAMNLIEESANPDMIFATDVQRPLLPPQQQPQT